MLCDLRSYRDELSSINKDCYLAVRADLDGKSVIRCADSRFGSTALFLSDPATLLGLQDRTVGEDPALVAKHDSAIKCREFHNDRPRQILDPTRRQSLVELPV